MGICKGCGDEFIFISSDFCGQCKKKLSTKEPKTDCSDEIGMSRERQGSMKRRHSMSVGSNIQPIELDNVEDNDEHLDLVASAKRTQHYPPTTRLEVKLDDPKDKGRIEGLNSGKIWRWLGVR